MKIFRFVDFEVYVKSKLLYARVVRLTERMKDFPLKDQTRKASLSVALHIAQGSAKKSDTEFARYLQVSLGALNELYACFDIMHENKLIDSDTFQKMSNESRQVARQLGGFAKKLRSEESLRAR